MESNQRGTPLYSMGLAWQASKEPFYRMDWLPMLKFRATYGHNGNVSKMTAPQATISFTNIGAIPTRSGLIRSLPNERLRWERVKMFNAGIDFATTNQSIVGTVEYYQKRSTDLLGQAPLDPTLGMDAFYGNVANMEGRGVDASVSVRPLSKRFNWTITGIFSFSESKVSRYLMPPGPVTSFIGFHTISPIEGKPLFSLFGGGRSGISGASARSGPDQDPRAGDVFGIWVREKGRIGHAGFVERWEGGWCVTIEGNSANAVRRVRRPVSTIYRVADWITVAESGEGGEL